MSWCFSCFLCFRIVFAPKKVPHPNIIPFKEKVTNLEPEISPYYGKVIIQYVVNLLWFKFFFGLKIF